MKNKKPVLLTSLVILSPIVAGLLLWSRLPEQVAIHFDVNGNADGWGSRAMAVFPVPLVILGGQLLIALGGRLDHRVNTMDERVMQTILWLLPVISVVVSAVVYCKALGMAVNVLLIAGLLLACFLVVLGNLMPKADVNSMFGIRIPTTMRDPENWRMTHRIGAWSMSIGGILMIIAALLQLMWLYIALLLVSALTPILYSVVRYCRDRRSQ